VRPLPPPVDLIPQNPRTSESDYSPCIKHQIFTSLRVPSPPSPLLFQTEFPKLSDEDIFAVFKGPFNGLYKGVNQVGGVSIGKAEVVMNGFGDAGLGEGHDGGTCFPVRKPSFKSLFCQYKSLLINKMRELCSGLIYLGSLMFFRKKQYKPE